MNFNFINNAPQGGGRSRTLVTAKTFFSTEGNVGYFSDSTFGPMMVQMKSQAPGLYAQYNAFFNCLKEGFLIKNPIIKKTHLTNLSDYYFLKFQKGRIKVEVTIYDIDNIGKFINDYANNLIDTNFTLDDLLQEINN
ncbi:MAG TPA: hypothetical protein VGB63_14660 [Pedobacter sp.]|jgi:hypothetical protein